MSGEEYVSLWVPGRRTRKLATTALVAFLILLTVLGSIGTVLPGIMKAFTDISPTEQPLGTCSTAPSNSTTTPTNLASPCSSTETLGGNTPNFAGADPVPNLSLPKTTLSSVDSLIGSSGIIQASAQNLTLRAPGLSLRLLGGVTPHDELVGPMGKRLSSLSSWEVQTNINGSWVRLSPSSSNFTTIGTNSTGTFVVRAMHVNFGTFSGNMKVAYKATSLGTLKWNIQFVPNTTGRYRLVYKWDDISNTYNVQPVLKKFQVNYSGEMYTMSWGDVPAPYNTTAQVNSGTFLLSIDLGIAAKGSLIIIDPSLIGSSSSSSATAYTFQRKIFYEPVGGYYWAFYFNGTHFNYSNSPNGTKWATPQPVPTGVDLSGNLVPSVFNYQQSVVVAGGSSSSCSSLSTCSASVQLPYYVGTISGSTINWGSIQYADYRSRTCQTQFPWQTCNLTIGLEYVNVEQNSAGTLVFSYIYYSTDNGFDVPPMCNSGSESEMAAVVKFLGGASLPVCFVDEAGPIVVPSNSLGQVTLLYETNNHLNAAWINSNGQSGSPQSLGSILSLSAFSAVSDDNYEIHVIFNAPDTTTVYAHLSASSGSSWTNQQNIFPGKTQPATLTLDRSTGKLYAFAINGSSIIIKAKPPSEAWIDGSVSYQIDNRMNPAYLGSNFASVSATKYNKALLVWTEGTGGHNYSVTFASIPIQTVWSPYSSPADPWTGTGLAPYGQYFANLGEFVSPSTGMLTVKQTDLTVPGRRLDLDFTRVYVEAFSFSNNIALNDSESWIPMGNGWQFNFPWMSRLAPNPLVIHLKDGQGYRIPSSFWAGTTSTFENHQGQNFRLVRVSSGNITLYDSSGISYGFDSSHKLNTITDATGNNTITFTYTNGIVSCITDTAARAFTFSYASGLLQTLAQVTGSCASPGSAVRSISYANSGQNLVSVTDPAGRSTFYSYNATNIATVAAWLLSRIRYPTLWLTNYTYTPVILGAQTVTYRVNLEKTGPSPTSPIRQYQYSYSNPVGDQITSASVAAFNGTQLAGYTKYAFSFLGDTRNITDANGKFVTGIQQVFGVDGQIPSEIHLVTDGQHIGSFTNYYNYDLWGNLIYSRSTISSSPAKSHESFSAYYNDGLPPGFNAFQDTFSQLNGTFSDSSWLTYNGTWRVRNGVYNGTETGLSADGMFAWANISRTDLSLQSRVSVTSAVDTRPGYLKFGLFTHYTTWLYKWALVIHTVGSYAYLEFLDEWNAWLGDTQSSARNPCSSWTIPLVSYGVWYTFNMTVHGNVATGWVSAPGQSPCSVRGIFSSSSPAVSGMGFGLYAGGFSALFDNVTATTVTSAITGTSFSNSFIQNGAPNPNIHGAPAGTAQLQNGAGSQPEETYYGYYPWGGVNQIRSRYDPPAVQGSPNPLALDGSASNGCTNAYSSCSTTLSTSHSNDIIIAYASESLDLQTSCSFSISDSAGLAWMSRGPNVSGNGGRDQLQEFWARSPSTLSSDVITETITGCGNNYNGLQVFGITGANFNVPFDPVYGLAASASGSGYGTSVTLSTSNPNDIIVAGVQHGALVPTAGTSFTSITSYAGVGIASEYKTVTTATSNLNVTFSDTASASWEEIADSVQANPATQSLITSRTYDIYGNLKTLTDPRGNTTSYGYSSTYKSAYLTSLSQTLVPGGTLISTSDLYNFTTGTVLSRVDANGNSTAYKYDTLGRVLKVTYPNNDFVSYAYNDRANYVNITNENGWLTQQQYDGLARLSTVNRFLNSKLYSNTTNSYNWQDRTLTTRDPFGNSYNYSYDALGRITNSTAPDRKSVLQNYNDLASSVLTTSQDGNFTCKVYDRLGRLTSVIEYANSNCTPKTLNPLTYVTNNYYDEVGNLRMVTNAATKSTTYSYDNLNRLTSISYPDGTYEVYSYDSNGNLVEKIDRAGIKTLSAYDSINRPTTTTYLGTPPTTSISYTYDKNNNILKSQNQNAAINQNATITYTYDSRNRATSEAYAVMGGPYGGSYALFYSYQGENLRQVYYPDALKANYTYDALGRVLSVFTTGGATYATFSYNKDDTLRGIGFGNGVVGNYTYDVLGRMSTLILKQAGGTAIALLTYLYDKTGRTTSTSGQINSVSLSDSYNYDAVGRLTNATLTSGGTTTSLWYEYDNLGNRLRQSQNGAITTYIYNATNSELRSYTGPTSATYTYDLTGDLKTQSVAGTTWTYTWDGANKLLNAASNGVTKATYVYDAAGRRIETTESGSTTFTAYIGTETLWEQSGSTFTDHIFAGGLRIGTVSSTTLYYQNDGLGSTILLTTNAGSVLFADNYKPFGQDNGTPTGSATYKFTGKPVSATTGLYYEFQRWYDSSIGRFISWDPGSGDLSSPQSLNPYVYVSNAPTFLTDPTGQDQGMHDHSACVRTNTSCNGPDPVLAWWNGLTPAQKGLVILGVVITVAIVSCAIGCEGFAAVPEAVAGAGFDLSLGGLSLGGLSTGALGLGTLGLGFLGLDLGITELGTLLHPSTGDPSGQSFGGGGQSLGNPRTGLADMGKGEPDKNPDYNPRNFPRPRTVEPGTGVPSDSRGDKGKVCGALAVLGGIVAAAAVVPWAARNKSVVGQLGYSALAGFGTTGFIYAACIGS